MSAINRPSLKSLMTRLPRVRMIELIVYPGSAVAAPLGCDGPRFQRAGNVKRPTVLRRPYWVDPSGGAMIQNAAPTIAWLCAHRLTIIRRFFPRQIIDMPAVAEQPQNALRGITFQKFIGLETKADDTAARNRGERLDFHNRSPFGVVELIVRP